MREAGGGTKGETAGLLARWGRWRRLADPEADLAIAAWRRCFAIGQQVGRERVSPYQVTNERGRRGCSLVGVVFDAASATIHHTRALTTEDIVHELLHVRHPGWTEAAVVAETGRLLRGESAPVLPPEPSGMAPGREGPGGIRPGAAGCASCQASATFRDS